MGIDGDKKGWDASHPQIGDKMGMGIGMEKSARDASLYKPGLYVHGERLVMKKTLQLPLIFLPLLTSKICDYLNKNNLTFGKLASILVITLKILEIFDIFQVLIL